MRVMILGGQGYLGWPSAMHLASIGHEVTIVDNGLKSRLTQETGDFSLTLVQPAKVRAAIFHECTGVWIESVGGDVTDYGQMCVLLKRFAPDAIVHYAEIPSAPFSMRDYEAARLTVINNVGATLALAHAVKECCPGAHIIKLGTMGEYGTPNVPISEGWLEHQHNGYAQKFLYPATPGSLYHVSKVQDTHVLWLYSRMYGLRVTDVMQGPVYGLTTPQIELHEDLATSFYYDDLWGTVINRFVVQALIGEPLTVYGSGGQKRGFINLRDVVKCIELMLANPPAGEDYRIFNQITSVHSVKGLADLVVRACSSVGVNAQVGEVRNPRQEAEDHFYSVEATGLRDLGLEPTQLNEETLAEFIEAVRVHIGRVNRQRILPRNGWTAFYTDAVDDAAAA